MSNGIEEVISTLYEMVQDAWSLPLGADKCVLERDKVLDLLDEINNQLPGEFKQAKTIVDARNEVITNAKREAEALRKSAEEKARTMVEEQEVVRVARARSAEMIASAEAKSNELRRVASEYVDDIMRQAEESMSAALSTSQASHNAFKTAGGAKPGEKK